MLEGAASSPGVARPPRRGGGPPRGRGDSAAEPSAERERRGPERAAPLVRREDLRRHLPGLEPERRLTDWGRSERVEALVDRTLADFLYHLWFRCEVEGIENVPGAGGALLVSNHAGALPPDAVMIAKALREEHPRARALNFTARPAFKGYPGFSMLLPKVGCVADHPANLHRLLHDEEALVLKFPEGRRGPRKLYKDRYRLRPFEDPGFVASAARAGAPIVPVCVIGSEEAAPVFARLDRLGPLAGRLMLPLAPTFPHLGPLPVTGYLPAKFKIRFLEPVAVEGAADDRASAQAAAEEIRARMQDALFEMVGARDSVWLG